MRRRERDTRRRERAYRRARIRHFLFTVGPHRVSGGRITRRHLAQEVVVNDTELCSPQWPTSFDGLRIGHVSDFHLGDLLPLDKALEVVEELGRQQPELIACTGDLVDLDSPDSGRVLEALAAIDAPLGCFFVLGNHDELHDPRGLVRTAREVGVTVLQNEAVCIRRNGHPMVVAGIEWAKSSLQCSRFVDAAAGDENPHLLLAHNPKAFLQAADRGIALTLAGHTHGGQIAFKSRPNANLALTHRHSAGMFQADGSLLYVTSGVGAWFPLRLNCPAEIAMLTVRHVPEEEEGPDVRARGKNKRRGRRKKKRRGTA